MGPSLRDWECVSDAPSPERSSGMQAGSLRHRVGEASCLARRAVTPLLFVSRNGHRPHANPLAQIVRAYLRGAGVAKPGACHLFRHTAATLMLEGGADVRYIQAL
ncbi:MAG: hypothetical protein FJ297_18815, partial [Planctomycetes bacterium]|nr:hypothetical protein [Planctomycetota bacterium]